MSAASLLEHYDRIADAPDAVERLRRFVLDLAVRGKLVPQDPRDEPASELLKSLKRQPSDDRRKPRLAAKVEAADPTYNIPSSWRWVRIGDHLDLINGMAFKPTDWLQTGIKIVRIQNLNRLDASFNYCDLKNARARVLIDDGAFLISWSGTPGTSFGAFIWDRGPAALNQHIFRCDFRLKAFDTRYLRLAINGRLDEMIAAAHGGVGLQHITKGKLEALLIALPPLAEQHRIVAKVDELTKLCDSLEATRADREAARDRLAATSLARLKSPDPKSFQDDARFALNALTLLTKRPGQIKQLRQTILDLAVRGRLVAQCPTDEREKLPTDACETPPPEIPTTWSYVRLANLLAEDTRNGYSRKPDDAPDGTPILRISAGTVRRDGVVAEEEHKLISGIDPEDRVQYGLRRGDLLACRFNGNKAFVGRFTIFDDYLGIRPIYPDKLIRIRVAPQFALASFLRIAGDSDLVRGAVERACATTVGNWGISASNLKEIRFPVPPILEQRQIIAKVDELMGLCDRLEANLISGDETRSRLLDALLADALAPSKSRDMEAVA